ncbi:mechanosensitive ion channel family protein [Romeria aff. gracilis LEGE 07310]|uniref:Mechanosensitive ion channel family protein n=1 Tax=Vasconcelosia minhoensis LEGE 07310 TaxID=915328 RepID=A0A8J7DNG9_9CYAN|nr:mechanosensitive ion channel family protein [Romeria gracilis]MBE9080046.1 mechanosensitive ion channel family protein [Romeria aff. gracilis LEGE 07310]
MKAVRKILIWAIAVGLSCLLIGSPSWAQETPGAEYSILSRFDQLGLSSLKEVFQPETDPIETLTVWLDGVPLFEVAAAGEFSAATRVNEIEKRLRQAARQGLQTNLPPVTWQIDPDSNLPVLSIGDRFLMTVTEQDARAGGVLSTKIRAAELEQAIEAALRRYRLERQPRFLRQQLPWAGGILLAMIMISGLLRFMRGRLVLPAASGGQPESWQGRAARDFLSPIAALRERVTVKQRRYLRDFKRWGFRLAQVAVWGGGSLVLLGLSPYTRPWQPFLLNVLRLPLIIILVIVLCYGVIRLGEVLINRLFLAVQEEALPDSVRSQRLTLRFSTFSQVSKNILATFVIIVGVLAVFARLGVDLTPLLAGAGIIGLALSLASQNVLKDIINGFFILMEDHYGVGDVIIVGDVAGFVETMNLRITQLRNEEGRLITVPNGQIGVVQNLSKDWSRVDLLIPVSLESDIDKALAIIADVAEEMRQEPDWQSLILEPPLVLGVDNLDHAGATVRLWIVTAPLKQWDVAREYRRRLKNRFDQMGIVIGVPQQTVHVHPDRTAPAVATAHQPD